MTDGTASVQAPVTQPVMPTPSAAVPDGVSAFVLAATAMVELGSAPVAVPLSLITPVSDCAAVLVVTR